MASSSGSTAASDPLVIALLLVVLALSAALVLKTLQSQGADAKGTASSSSGSSTKAGGSSSKKKAKKDKKATVAAAASAAVEKVEHVVPEAIKQPVAAVLSNDAAAAASASGSSTSSKKKGKSKAKGTKDTSLPPTQEAVPPSAHRDDIVESARNAAPSYAAAAGAAGEVDGDAELAASLQAEEDASSRAHAESVHSAAGEEGAAGFVDEADDGDFQQPQRKARQQKEGKWEAVSSRNAAKRPAANGNLGGSSHINGNSTGSSGGVVHSAFASANPFALLPGDAESPRPQTQGRVLNLSNGHASRSAIVNSASTAQPQQQQSRAAVPGAAAATNGGGTSKKQRQNAAKRDAAKQAKAAAEQDRLAALALHKRELERERIKEAYDSKKPAAAKASVNEKGHLVWD